MGATLAAPSEADAHSKAACSAAKLWNYDGAGVEKAAGAALSPAWPDLAISFVDLSQDRVVRPNIEPR